MRRAASIAFLTTTVAAALAVPAGAASPVRGAGDSPRMQAADASLHGVLAVAEDEAVVIGSRTGFEASRATSEVWDGARWTRAGVPAGKGSTLTAVGRVGQETWAVGDAVSEDLVLRWRSGQWERVPGAPSDPRAISGTTPDDVWVGLLEPGAAHWDGTGWESFSLPLPYGNTNGNVNDVIAIALDDVWAVGRSTGQREAHLLAHWDGVQWSSADIGDVLADAGLPRSINIRGIDATASDDVWAVGSARSSTRQVILHWDGRVWTASRGPASEGPLESLQSVSAIAADDVWAAGYAGPSNATKARLLHWDGRRWTEVAAPKIRHRHQLADISASGPDDVWVVGKKLVDHVVWRPVRLRYDGERWARG